MKTAETFTVLLALDLRGYKNDHPDTAKEKAFQNISNKLASHGQAPMIRHQGFLRLTAFEMPDDESEFAWFLAECKYAEIPYQSRYMREFSRGGTARTDAPTT